MVEARLDKTRLDNDSVGFDVVSAHNELEGAIGELLGVPTGTEINSAILGSVESDGGIYRLRFKDAAGSSTAAGASGFEIRDGVVRKRFVLANGHIQTWVADDPASDTTDWTLIHDFEDEEAPAITDLTDVGFSSYDSGDVGMIVGVGTKPNGDFQFVLMVDQIVNAGATGFIGLEDITQAFKPNIPVLGVIFNPNVVDQYIGVGDNDKLVPITNEDGGNLHFEARSVVESIGRVGFGGGEGQGWTNVRWQDQPDSSTIIGFETFNGVSAAGFELTEGIWRVVVGYSRSDGVKDGFISWKINGAETAPRDSIMRQHNPWQWKDNLFGAPAIGTPLQVNRGLWGDQEQYLIIPDTRTVGLVMGRESSESFSLTAHISAARIV